MPLLLVTGVFQRLPYLPAGLTVGCCLASAGFLARPREPRRARGATS